MPEIDSRLSGIPCTGFGPTYCEFGLSLNSYPSRRQEINEDEKFWRSPEETKATVVSLVRNNGAQYDVSSHVPEGVKRAGWTAIPETDYYYRKLAP